MLLEFSEEIGYIESDISFFLWIILSIMEGGWPLLVTMECFFLIRNYISKGESTTGFSTNCLENNHTFSKDKINLLHPGRKGFGLNRLEHLEIRRGLKTAKFVTKDQTIFDSSILVSPFIIIILNKHMITFAWNHNSLIRDIFQTILGIWN